MFIIADQLLAHAIGDFVLQSQWMADTKTKSWIPAFLHALIYSFCFLAFRPSFIAWFVIFSTHYIIDRYRLARYVIYAKNFPSYSVPAIYNESDARKLTWQECKDTGSPPHLPSFLSVWLLIIVDNIMHIVINGLALKYL